MEPSGERLSSMLGCRGLTLSGVTVLVNTCVGPDDDAPTAEVT